MLLAKKEIEVQRFGGKEDHNTSSPSSHACLNTHKSGKASQTTHQFNVVLPDMLTSTVKRGALSISFIAQLPHDYPYTSTMPLNLLLLGRDSLVSCNCLTTSQQGNESTEYILLLGRDKCNDWRAEEKLRKN